EKKEIEKGLEVDGREFWASHLDFNGPVAHTPALVGRSRAREMVVNILLPFLHARAYLLEDCDLRRRTLDLYRGLPPGHGNEFTQEM
ncbi:MAG: DUF2851 family protein, partial [Dehalococcoidia bacterium]|nr:DUF2851 family protein [Dehalococcoidia bacterium]